MLIQKPIHTILRMSSIDSERPEGNGEKKPTQNETVKYLTYISGTHKVTLGRTCLPQELND